MGLIVRKLLAEVGQAVAVAAAASSSTPSPFPRSDESDLATPVSQKPDVNPIIAITAALLMSTFFIISFFSIYFQRCFTHVADFHHDRIMILYNGGPTPSTVVPPSGLDRRFLETLPKVIFSSSSSDIQKEKKKEKETTATTECAICLEEFSEQETLRLLPHCGHSFHLECINMWLFSHTACPLCRHSLLHPDDAKAIAIAVDSLNNTAMVVNSVTTEEAMQMRAVEKPKKTGGEGEEEGESSENRAL